MISCRHQSIGNTKEMKSMQQQINTLNFVHFQRCICRLCFSRQFNDSNYATVLKCNNGLYSQIHLSLSAELNEM